MRRGEEERGQSGISGGSRGGGGPHRAAQTPGLWPVILIQLTGVTGRVTVRSLNWYFR